MLPSTPDMLVFNHDFLLSFLAAFFNSAFFFSSFSLCFSSFSFCFSSTFNFLFSSFSFFFSSFFSSLINSFFLFLIASLSISEIRPSSNDFSFFVIFLGGRETFGEPGDELKCESTGGVVEYVSSLFSDESILKDCARSVFLSERVYNLKLLTFLIGTPQAE